MKYGAALSIINGGNRYRARRGLRGPGQRRAEQRADRPGQHRSRAQQGDRPRQRVANLVGDAARVAGHRVVQVEVGQVAQVGRVLAPRAADRARTGARPAARSGHLGCGDARQDEIDASGRSRRRAGSPAAPRDVAPGSCAGDVDDGLDLTRDAVERDIHVAHAEAMRNQLLDAPGKARRIAVRSWTAASQSSVLALTLPSKVRLRPTIAPNADGMNRHRLALGRAADQVEHAISAPGRPACRPTARPRRSLR